MQMGNKAAQGDLPAARTYLGLLQLSESSEQSNGLALAFDELDAAVKEDLVERILRTSTHPSETPTDGGSN
jgi:hypothetical protein